MKPTSPPSQTPQRGATRLRAAVVLAALAGLLLAASPANAADAYRYWTYWWGTDGQWTFATAGAADREITDGTVEGWLLQVTDEMTPTTPPAASTDFDQLCPQAAPAARDQVRAAVVIDYGIAEHAPTGETPPAGPVVECVTLPVGSTGDDALAAAAEVRREAGATCGIDGYPATGCFDAVAAPVPASAAPAESGAADESTDGSTATWLMSLAGLAALVVAGGVLLARSRSASTLDHVDTDITPGP